MLHSILSGLIAFTIVFTMYYLFIKWYLEHCFVDRIMKEVEANIKSFPTELPMDENPLVSGGCIVQDGLIIREEDEKKEDDHEMTEDELREYFWG